MPAVSHLLLPDLADPNTISALSRRVVETAAQLNTTAPRPLQVICAFPVSGQYGPGSRILYYVLVAACVLARKTEWLRNACLAAALIFPAVAAIHGVTLAALHVEGAIDMDIYGAFQFCSIGILTAPATVRLSTTYFKAPGRNTIFIWTVLLLMGLLALTVEFFRSDAVDCKEPASNFAYGLTTCGLRCSIDEGPVSKMRKGSADEIFVVPEPTILTFGTTALLSAACCVPALVSMASMWDKILKVNWKERFGGDDNDDEVIEGTNGATDERMNKVNDIIRGFLSVIEIPIYAAAVVAILVMGERNFWSTQVNYQTEPMQNVGQWAPIVASGLAACGSLYMVLAETEANTPYLDGQCNCSHHHYNNPEEEGHGLGIITLTPTDRGSQEKNRNEASDAGKRFQVARMLHRISISFGTAGGDPFDDWTFQHSEAANYPRVPGEETRSRRLHQIEAKFNSPQLGDDSNDDARSRRSRANSFTGSVRGTSASKPRPPGLSPRASSPRPSSSGGALLEPPAAKPDNKQAQDSDSRQSCDSEPQNNTDVDTPSPSALPGTTLTLHTSRDYPSITVSSEHEPPVGPTVPPAVHPAPR